MPHATALRNLASSAFLVLAPPMTMMAMAVTGASPQEILSAPFEAVGLLLAGIAG